MEKECLTAHTQLDTLIGTPGGKIILTLLFTAFKFMFGILLDNKTAAQATLKFREVKRTLAAGGFVFTSFMPVMLTDIGGGEFSDVFAFENDLDSTKEASLYFCNPMQSCQKAQIEKNHTLFRDIVPKGSSFDCFTQDTVNLIFLTSTVSTATFTAARLLMQCLRLLFPRSLPLFSGSLTSLRKMSCSPLCF